MKFSMSVRSYAVVKNKFFNLFCDDSLIYLELCLEVNCCTEFKFLLSLPYQIQLLTFSETFLKTW